MNTSNMNGADVTGRHGGAVFIRLPRELWRPCGPCNCSHCKGAIGYWDTLAVSAKAPKRADYAWTVHHPEIHFKD